MIRSICFTSPNDPPIELPLAEVPSALRHPDNLVWVDVSGPNDNDLLQVLDGLFRFHPLAIDDCLQNGKNPSKIDDFGSHLFIIVHAVDRQKAFPYLVTSELDLFLGANYLVTCHPKEDLSPIITVREQLARDERLVQNGADFLCYTILNHLVEEYEPLVEEIEVEVEALEDHILARPNPRTLERLLSLKHGVLSFYRTIGPLSDVINRLSRDPFPVIDMQSRIYFRDIFDHLNRLESTIDLIREMVTGAQEIYLNATSLRLNGVMKALTIVSTIFLPLSFIAGVYGMNFVNMPELRWPFGYFLIWGVFILVAGLMLYFFKKRGWF